MNQVAVSWGTDANEMCGYAQATNAYLGRFDLLVENTGDTIIKLQVKEATSTTTSGYRNIGSLQTIQPRGRKTVSVSALSRKIGFFGSGEKITADGGGAAAAVGNVSVVLANKADLRGAQIDIVAVGRRNWTWDKGLNKSTLAKAWGNAPDYAEASGLGFVDANESDGFGGSITSSE